jgi:UDP-N-acetyl-D-galactosamine dehydrogenase
MNSKTSVLSNPLVAEDVKIAIIGLGYVGLPLAVEFGKQVKTFGYDINAKRIRELESGVDSTLETTAKELAEASKLAFTASKGALRSANVFIVTVPTPVDEDKRPDLSPLEKASQLVGEVIHPGCVVIFESTVFPGCTQEVCVPIIEQHSGLVHNVDFFTGYSPERINPGDREHRLTNVIKITSGSTSEAAEFVDQLYNLIVKAGTHKASSIAVAEAAKVIENVQRDVNIALVNELALIFKRLGIDTNDVLQAAGTKWNFLPFKPGLVGGHCIGVDPYYLVTKAERAGFEPRIISAARQVNESVGTTVSIEVMRLMTQKRIHIVDANILVMGLAFKENCPDLRNTRVVDIIRDLTTNNAIVDIFDPWVDALECRAVYGLDVVTEPVEGKYDAIILAVAHDQFRAMSIDSIRSLGKENCVIYDIKYLLPKDAVDGRL